MSGFRRLVLELGHGAVDQATLGQAAAFAQLLDAELHALFVEDETLMHASALPFAREISSLSFQWRTLESDRLQTDLRAAAEQARRQLIEAASATGVRQHFEVRRGDLTLHVTETCVATDIVVVGPVSRVATHGSHRLRETADRSLASLLFLPDAPARRQGSIVAVVTGSDDPSLAVARSIAALGQARVLVLAPHGEDVDGDVRAPADATVQDLVAALGETRERLIVVTRAASLDGRELAAARGVPVLVVEPGEVRP
jgi:hypothetical protein